MKTGFREQWSHYGKKYLLVCFSSIHSRWHNSWIPLHVWLITLQDQGGKCAGERKVQMCHIFLKSLFLSGVKAVKMCTGPSALVHWAASPFLHFLFKLRRPREPLCVIRLYFYLFIVLTLSPFIFTPSHPSWVFWFYRPLFFSLSLAHSQM